MFCDNKAVVQVVESGKGKDNFLAACIRNVWLLSATFEKELSIEHIACKHNIIADFLSRLHFSSHSNQSMLAHLKQNYIWDRIDICNFDLDLHI